MDIFQKPDSGKIYYISQETATLMLAYQAVMATAAQGQCHF